MGAVAQRPPFFRNRWQRALAPAFLAWWVAMAVAPVHRFDWFLENLLIPAYEAIEWVTAMIVNSEAGDVFLGTQGDFFDAQKDHTLAITGALISFAIAKILKSRGRLPKPA